MTTLQLFAQSYTSARGFPFSSLEEYEERAAARPHVEEYEITLASGGETETRLFDAMQVGQSNLALYLEMIDKLSGAPTHEVAAMLYLTERLMFNAERAWEQRESVHLFEGSPEDYAESRLNDGLFGELSDAARRYIDVEAIARDMNLNGEIAEYSHGGVNYVITNGLEL